MAGKATRRCRGEGFCIWYGVAKPFQTLTHPDQGVAARRPFIIDNTADARVGRHIEDVSHSFDHGVGKTGLGFADLVLDPAVFSIHAE